MLLACERGQNLGRVTVPLVGKSFSHSGLCVLGLLSRGLLGLGRRSESNSYFLIDTGWDTSSFWTSLKVKIFLLHKDLMEIELDNINIVFCSWWWLMLLPVAVKTGLEAIMGRKWILAFYPLWLLPILTWYFLPRYYVVHSVFTIWNIWFQFLVYAITSLKPFFFSVQKWFAISVGSSSYFQKRWTALGLFWNSRLNWNKGENILIGEEQMFPVWLSLLWSLLLMLLYLLSLVSFFLLTHVFPRT